MKKLQKTQAAYNELKESKGYLLKDMVEQEQLKSNMLINYKIGNLAEALKIKNMFDID